MLQADPPPKAVKVVVSKRVPLVGEELIAYEEEQDRIKKEALKASLIKEEELKTSHGSDNNNSDPMVIDSGNNHVPPEGMCSINYFGAILMKRSYFFILSRKYKFGTVLL